MTNAHVEEGPSASLRLRSGRRVRKTTEDGWQNHLFALHTLHMADFPKKTPADWEKLAAKELRDKPLSSLDWMTPRASR